MTRNNAVTGGRFASARHRASHGWRGPTPGVRAVLPAARGAVFGLVGLALVFTSGYLVGTDTSTQATAAGSVTPAGGRAREAGAPRQVQAGKDAGSVPVTSGTQGSASGKSVSKVSAARHVALPASVDIPALDLHESLTGLDVVDSTLQAPQRWNQVGWWQDGPVPGEAGSAVVVGHVDSPTGPAVFYGLSALVEGDTISVRRVDNSTAKFRVSSTELVSRSYFPSEQVYRRDGRPTLSLLTCGGTYDHDLGSYDSNVLVTAYLVDDARAKDPRAKDQRKGEHQHKHQHKHQHQHRATVRDGKVVARG